jgi:hypothetical protein
MRCDIFSRSLNVTGGWTWFGGPRAVSVDIYDVVAIVRPRNDIEGRAEAVLVALDRITGDIRSEVVLSPDVSLDDHNVPGITFLDAGTILAGHTDHHLTREVILTKVSFIDGVLVRLESMTIFFPDLCTYVYLFRSGQKILLLTRSINFNWTGVWLDPEGNSPTNPFIVFPWAVEPQDGSFSGRDGNRPYLIVRPGRSGSAVFALTNDHPRAYRNGVYAGRIREGIIEDLFGRAVFEIGSDQNWSPFEKLTQIFPAGQKYVPWVQDLAEDSRGSVYLAVSGRPKTKKEFLSGRDRIRDGYTYRVFRWGPHSLEMVSKLPAGSSLYAGEEDYVGGIALNPRDPRHVVFSSQGFLSPGKVSRGARWQLWETRLDVDPPAFRLLSGGPKDSSSLRPAFSQSLNQQGHSLFYLRGLYSSYRNIRTTLTMVPFVENESCFELESSHYDLPFVLSREPNLPPKEREFFEDSLGRAHHYLEFGGGSSTLLALSLGVKEVTTIDTDSSLIALISRLAPSMAADNEQVFTPIRLRARAIGAWGYPLGKGSTDVSKQIRKALARVSPPDVVLIDGRYRLASFLAVIQTLRRPLTVLFDDYTSREAYWRAEEVVRPSQIVGRIAVFSVTERVKVPRKLAKLSRDISI